MKVQSSTLQPLSSSTGKSKCGGLLSLSATKNGPIYAKPGCHALVDNSVVRRAIIVLTIWGWKTSPIASPTRWLTIAIDLRLATISDIQLYCSGTLGRSQDLSDLAIGVPISLFPDCTIDNGFSPTTKPKCLHANVISSEESARK